MPAAERDRSSGEGARPADGPAGRGGRAVLPAAAAAFLLAPVLVAVLPILAQAAALAPAAVTTAPAEGARPTGAILARTLAVAVGAAMLATIAALPLGLALGRGLRAGGTLVLVAAVLPATIACLPPGIVFHAWWTLWPPDGPVYAAALERGLVPELRAATLLVGLAAWAMPLPAWIVAASARTPDPARTARRLEGTGPLRETGAALRRHAAAIGAAVAATAVVLAGETAAFDLAQVFSFGNELRAIDALGATPAQVLRAGWPALAVAAAAGGLAWWWLGGGGRPRAGRAGARGRGGRDGRRLAGREDAGSPLLLASGLVPLVLLAVVPLVLLVRASFGAVDPGVFLRLHGPGILRTAGAAAASGVLAGLACAVLVVLASTGRIARTVAGAISIACLVVALVPGSLAAALLAAAWSAAPAAGGAADLWASCARAVAGSPVIVVLGQLARFAAVAALLARIAVLAEPAAARDARRLDGLDRLGRAGPLFAAIAPRLVPASVAAGLVVLVLSLGEIPVTARVHPPGFDPVMVAVMNAMHYQRPETAALASVLLAACGTLAGAVLVVALAKLGRGTTRPGSITARTIGGAAVLASTLVLVPGCGDAGADAAGGRPLPTLREFGGHGLGPGRFSRPRCLDASPAGDRLVVIDKTARVQVLDAETGAALAVWRMPASDTGKPTGVTWGPDGRIWVADTHQHRVSIFAADGTLERTIGTYGEEDGAFIYPTDVAFHPDGTVWVSEYGGNDRVQVFTREGDFVRSIGGFGWDEDRFNRPQALAFSPDGRELFVADACNHRIVVRDAFAADAPVLRVLGGAGTGPGRLHYPYGLDVLADGTLLVTEFGNHRLQRLAPDGSSLGTFGRAGTRPGDLRYPWSAVAVNGEVFVLDSENDRVQVFRDPAGGGG